MCTIVFLLFLVSLTLAFFEAVKAAQDAARKNTAGVIFHLFFFSLNMWNIYRLL